MVSIDRRAFVRTAGTAIGAGVASHLLNSEARGETNVGSNEMIYRTLGRTGERGIGNRIGRMAHRQT